MKYSGLALWLLVSLSLLSLPASAAFPVARQGTPLAEIVVSAEGEGPLLFAAEELQTWLRELTGAELPIRHDLASPQPKIILAVNPDGFAEDLAQIGAKDGYAVREKDGHLYVFGTKAKGVLNGVFRMLSKNTDIIWAHASPEYGTIFTKNPDLTLTQIDYVDIPKLSLRGWQFNTSSMDLELWSLRNGNNHGSAPKELLDKAGYFRACGGGHNLTGLFLKPEKYYADHPDFYPLINGERVNRPRTQLCFTNPDMTAAFIKEVDAFIQANLEYTTVNIHIEDNYTLCECEKCLQPITIDGKTVTIEDKNKFRSTQYFLFLNQVAKFVAERYPDKEIRTYAYFFTQEPPICAIEPNIRVLLAFIYKDARYPLQDPVNQATCDMFMGWAAMTKGLINRDYYGLTKEFPRPADYAMLSELRFMNQHGLERNYAEISRNWHKDPRWGNGTHVWDLNAYYFWVMTRGMWDLDVDYTELRADFRRRAFGPAADDMGEFYQTVEDGWRQIGTRSRWNDDPTMMWMQSVIDPGTTEACRAALTRAATKAVHPHSRRLVEGIRAAFEDQVGWVTQPFRGADVEINGEFKQLDATGAPENWELAATDMVTEDGQLCARVKAGPNNKKWVRSKISIPVEKGDVYLVKAIYKGKGSAYFGVFNYYTKDDGGQELVQIGGPRAFVKTKSDWQEMTYTLRIGGDRQSRKLKEIRAIMGAAEDSEIIFKSILLKKKQ